MRTCAHVLGKPSLRLIDALLDEPAPSISALADRVDRDQSHVTRLVNSLEAKDTVETTPTGKQSAKRVSLGASPVVDHYRTLAYEQHHVDFSDLLTTNVLRVSWFLSDWTQPATMENHLDISSRAITEALQTLRERALVEQDGWEYQIANGFEPLVALAEAATYAEWKENIQEQPTAATLVWTSPAEALCVTTTAEPTLSDTWSETGTARFHEYDVELLLTDQRLWYTGHKRLTPERAVAQSLMRDAGVRDVSYALLVAEKLESFDVEAFETHASWYDVTSAAVQAIETYLNTGELVGTVTPSEQEYQSLREQYDIAQQ